MSQRYANRDQIPRPSRSCGLGARDRWLAGVLAGWLGQMADVLHRDGDKDTDCCQEEAENGGPSRGIVVAWAEAKMLARSTRPALAQQQLSS